MSIIKNKICNYKIKMNSKECQKLAMRTNDDNANYRLRQAQVDNNEYDVSGILICLIKHRGSYMFFVLRECL